MPTPPPKGLPPPQLQNVKRPRGRFRETEFARAARVARDVGARLELDPETGVYTITFSDKADDPKSGPPNLLSNL